MREDVRIFSTNNSKALHEAWQANRFVESDAQNETDHDSRNIGNA